jgi:hypothetical protein
VFEGFAAGQGVQRRVRRISGKMANFVRPFLHQWWQHSLRSKIGYLVIKVFAVSPGMAQSKL